MPKNTPAHIVVIDDSLENLDELTTLLRRSGYDVAAFGDGAAAVRHLQSRRASLVVSDVLMPDMDGIEVLLHLKKKHPDVPMIAMTGVGTEIDQFYLRLMRNLGARAAFARPIDSSRLLETIAGIVGRRDPQICC